MKLAAVFALGLVQLAVPQAEAQSNLVPGKLLVARQGLGDPNFAETVILLLGHGPEGAFGLIVNRPGKTRLVALFPDLEPLKQRDDTLYFGGPVEVGHLNVLIRSEGPREGFRHVVDEVYVSDRWVALERWIVEGGGEFRLFAGYAGWAPGQLEAEESRGDWSVVAAAGNLVFDREPKSLWRKLVPRDPASWTRTGPRRPPVGAVLPSPWPVTDRIN